MVGDVGQRLVAVVDPVAEGRPAVGDGRGRILAGPISQSGSGQWRKETSQGSSLTSIGESGAEM